MSSRGARLSPQRSHASSQRIRLSSQGANASSQSGNALITTMVISIVLLLIVAVVATVVGTSFKQTVNAQITTQAYYTARSVNEMVVNWLDQTPWTASDASVSTGLSSQQQFVQHLINGSGWSAGVATEDNGHRVVQEYTPGDLGTPDMGTATVKVWVNHDATDGTANQVITVETTGYFANDSYTLTTQLYNLGTAAYPYQPQGSETPTVYSPAVWEATVDEINNPPAGSYYVTDPNPINTMLNQGLDTYRVGASTTNTSIATGGSNSATVKRDYNEENRLYVLGAGNTSDNHSSSNILINTLSNPISSASVSNREATWMETKNIFGENYSTGPRDTPYIDTRGSASLIPVNSKAQVLTPANGRLALNPINANPSVNVSFSSNVNTLTNVKFAMWTVGDTAGKDVRVRLTNGDGMQRRTSGIPYFATIGIDFYDNKTTAVNPVQIIDPNPLNDPSVIDAREYSYNIQSPTDITNPGVSSRTAVNGIAFYPNDWSSGTIYARANANESIDSELVFTGFGKIHTSYVGDYFGWANYINYHYGAIGQEYDLLITMQGLNGTTQSYANNTAGYPFPPVYWGKDFSLYLLDGALTTHGARIQQGVNIVNEGNTATGAAGGVIYTNRPLHIGGASLPSSLDNSYIGTYGTMDGFDGNYGWATLQTFQPYYNQVIKDTDLVFTAPNNKTQNSEIAHPDGINSVAQSDPYAPKAQGRVLSILGGNIYVGGNPANNALATLTIASEIKDGLAVQRQIGADGISHRGEGWDENMESAARYTENGNRMYIQPNSVTVDVGGKLVVKKNQNSNPDHFVSTFVVRGEMVLEAGAQVNNAGNTKPLFIEAGGAVTLGQGAVYYGTIFVAEGGSLNVNGATVVGDVFVYGTLNISGVVTINAPADSATASDPFMRNQDAHGIYVYTTPLSSTSALTVATGTTVIGTSGRIHSFIARPDITGSVADNLFCKSNFPNGDGKGRDPSNNLCLHFTTVSGIWQKQGSGS